MVDERDFGPYVALVVMWEALEVWVEGVAIVNKFPPAHKNADK